MPADPTPEEEVRRLERHYSVNPEGLVFARLADAYRRCGRLEPCLELLREGLDRHPDYAAGHLIRGRALREAGRPGEAAGCFRRVLELDAENLVALRSLAELAMERGDTDEARRWADRLEEADPFTSLTPELVNGEAADEAEEGRDDGDGGRRAEGEPAPGAARPTGSSDTPIPEEDGLAREIAAMADDKWWSSSSEPQEGGDGDPDVATETMARLYAQQGLHEEAAEVYRRLVERRPGEPELERRLEEMRRRASGGPEGDAPAPGGGGDGPAQAEGGRAESDGEDPDSDARDAVSAREHLRALLRGRAGRPGGRTGRRAEGPGSEEGTGAGGGRPG